MPIKLCIVCKAVEACKTYSNSQCLSCGRAARRANNKLPLHQWHNVKAGATRRSLDFDLTLEEFTDIISRKCVYGTLSEVKADHIGLDRIDNTKGYTVDNCLPCCSKHNQVRGPYLTYEEMLELVLIAKSVKDCGESVGGAPRRSLNPLLVYRSASEKKSLLKLTP